MTVILGLATAVKSRSSCSWILQCARASSATALGQPVGFQLTCLSCSCCIIFSCAAFLSALTEGAEQKSEGGRETRKRGGGGSPRPAPAPKMLTLPVKRLLHTQLQFLLRSQLWLQAEANRNILKKFILGPEHLVHLGKAFVEKDKGLQKVSPINKVLFKLSGRGEERKEQRDSHSLNIQE